VSPSEAPPEILVLRRFLPVARERVFAAWLDPVSLAQWMLPGSVTGVLVEVDPRVGGRFRIVMRHGKGDVEHWGEYLTIEPPSYLSFTWISANTDLRSTVVTIELLGRDGGTELTLTHRRLPPAKVEAHRNGWTGILEKLAQALTGGQTSAPPGIGSAPAQ
jgi:uncharacterized protein YndB with AHSA1/START domain